MATEAENDSSNSATNGREEVPEDADATRASMLERVSAGDDRAWNTLYAKYYPMLLTWAQQHGAKGLTSEQIAADVLFILVRRMPSYNYDSSQSWRGYLRTILKRELWRNGRKMQREANAVSQSLLEIVQDTNAEESLVGLLAEERELVVEAAIREVQQHVSETTFRAWEMCVREDVAPAEVAAALSLKIGSVYQAHHRVSEKIKLRVEAMLRVQEDL